MADRSFRAVLVGEGWPPSSAGGLNRYVASLHDALPRVGVAVRAVVLGPADDAPPSVALVRPSGLPLRVARFAARVTALARRADVLDVHFALYGLVPIVIGRRRRLGVVVHFHGPWADESVDSGAGALAARAKRAIERAVYRRADRLIVLSEHSRALLLDYGVDARRIVKIRPGVDDERFRPLTEEERAAARAAVGVEEGTRLVVAVRRLVPRMGLDLLLEAWRDVQDSGVDSVLCIIGDGIERSALEASILDLGLARSVRLLGKVDEDELAAWYATADLAVTPSVQLEGFGLVLLEALMSGTPVLASDVGGIREALDGLGEQHLVSPVDRASWSRALTRVLLDPDLLVSREEARRYAAEFSWLATAGAVREVYEAAATEASDRGRRRSG